ncbi:MAG: hypothetical protein JSS65_04235 [Armatimonadetes bacterium]|nr:hypothetical protein [Armatimonadota bacterium]
MAEAFTNSLAAERGLDVVGSSAGTVGGKALNPVAVQAMSEIGVPMDGQAPKLLTPEMVAESDLIVSMGCGVDAEACPVKFLVAEDWELDDPAGQPIEAVRAVRDAIRERVSALLDEWGGA